MMKILDYAGKVREIDVDLNDANILAAYMKVVTGDEILTVIYEDGSLETFDSSNNRMTDYFDEEYALKIGGELTETYKSKAFQERNSSYWDWYDDSEDEES